MFSRILKPWFVCRPSQIFRRARIHFFPSKPGLTLLRTAWGGELFADPHKTIGASIVRTGVHDLVVSEALFRLATPDSLVFDVGANVGYMTLIAACAAAPRGRVVAFEPHPRLFEILAQNVRKSTSSRALAEVHMEAVALGAHSGTAYLNIPTHFDSNDGVSSVSETIDTGESVPIRVRTLDEVLGPDSVDVVKLDVEGYEANVLRGAQGALSERRIKHIIFEEHNIEASEVVPLLRQANYTMFALGWEIQGPKLGAVEAGNLSTAYESATFIATADPDAVVNLMATRGWRALRETP